MKRITLAVALLLGGTSVAYANPPGLTPGPEQQVPQQEAGPGGWDGPRGPMERGPGRMQRDGRRGQRHRLPPRMRARLVAMFDRNQDGRLEGPERRAARQFVKRLLVRRAMAHQGGGREGGGRRGGGRGRGF